MQATIRPGDNVIRFGRFGAAVLLLLLVLCGPVLGADLVDQTLCDIQVLYVFDETESIDWPTLYYLNEEYGCRIDMVTVSYGDGFRRVTEEIPDRAIYLHRYFLDVADTSATDSLQSRNLLLDSLVAAQFRLRRPDVVLVAAIESDQQLDQLATRIEQLPPKEGSIFNIRKVYRHFLLHQDVAALSSSVTVNRRELYERYHERMQLEIPKLFPEVRVVQLAEVQLMRYELTRGTGGSPERAPDFLSGLASSRLIPVLDSVLGEGALKSALINRARNFVSFFNLSRRMVGARRVENLIAGYKELVTLEEQIGSESMLVALEDFGPYVSRLLERAQKAVLREIGMVWDGRIILRDSPHGPKLKYRVSLSVTGPKSIELSYLRFCPYWDSAVVILDPTSRRIAPHQTFIHEYLVDIDRSLLEAKMPESLTFAAEIVYGGIPLTVGSAIPVWEAPDLSIEFCPDFFFVEPSAIVEVDRVVSSMNWKAVISKPPNYSGVAHLNLETPRGVFAGAYRQTWQLERGRAAEIVRIPFSVSNLFESGIQQQTITLSVDDHTVAVDTGIVRTASCNIGDTVTVGLMPDSTGRVEDILRMSGATYWPLTDRALRIGDLDAYDVIIVGSGALRGYPSFRQIKGRLEEYLRYGGSLVVFGQAGDWPEGVLPVSFVPATETVGAAGLLNPIPEARVLNSPYAISREGVLRWFSKTRQVSAAVISPAEKVYTTPSGAALLSVSRLGDGQVIFCGLPLTKMISKLDLEAIHLFANILNY